MRERVPTNIKCLSGTHADLVRVVIHNYDKTMSKRDAEHCMSNRSDFSTKWYNDFRGVEEHNDGVYWAIKNSYHGLYVEKEIDERRRIWRTLSMPNQQRTDPVETINFVFTVEMPREIVTYWRLKFA